MRLLIVAVLLGLVVRLPVYAAAGDTLYVKQDIANVREIPGKNGFVVMRIPAGRKLTELRKHGEWVRVRINRTLGFEGWIHNSVIAAKKKEPESAKYEVPSAKERKDVEFANTHASDEFVLDLTGSPAVRTRVECRLEGFSGQYRITFEPGGIPKRYSLSGNALSCLVRRVDLSRGRLAISLIQNGELTASGVTFAPLSSIRVQSDGPWGWAKAQTFYDYLLYSKPTTNGSHAKIRLD